MSPQHAFGFFDDLRARLERVEIEHGGTRIPVTASIGVSANIAGSLDEMIREADALLYSAKESGRNRVVIADPAP